MRRANTEATRLGGRVGHSFLCSPAPVAIAHRGGAQEAPENTLPAFDAAVALGYRYLETDAHLTRDGVVVAFHDSSLDRVTDRRGAIAELDVATVQAADAGYSFSVDGGNSFPFRATGVVVPRLEDLLLCWPQAKINIDPKADACVPALVRLIDRLRAWDRVCIGAFSDRRLHAIRSLSGGNACTSMGPGAVAIARIAASVFTRMPRLGACCIQVPLAKAGAQLVTPAFISAAHRAGLPLHVWTINDAATMNWLLDHGVDGIMTDRLRLLGDVFEARGLSLSGDQAP
jgi:glycerophosphoryl diester phosphodiesterase